MVSAALERGSGDDVATRIAFIAILLLLGVGAGAFGLGLGRGLPNAAPAWATPAIGLLPALGLAAAASGVIPNLALIGGIAAAVSASAAALAVAARARQAS
jgi:hypothetical protein